MRAIRQLFALWAERPAPEPGGSLAKGGKSGTNGGMAILMVVAAIAILTLLMTSLLSMSLIGYKIKGTERESAVNQAMADAVLEQIRMGLQYEAIQVSNAAYRDAMEGESTANAIRARDFNDWYYFKWMQKLGLIGSSSQSLWLDFPSRLGYPTDPKYGDTRVNAPEQGLPIATPVFKMGQAQTIKTTRNDLLWGKGYDGVTGYDPATGFYKGGFAAYLDKDLAAWLYRSNLDPNRQTEYFRLHLINEEWPRNTDGTENIYPSFRMYRILDSNTPGNKTYQTEGLTIKGLVVELADEKGYYTKIVTDLHISLPTLTLMNEAKVPVIADYSLIADKGIVFKQTANTMVKDNVYAGGSGIKLEGSKVSLQNGNQVITRGDVVVDKNSSLQFDSNELWARGITVQGKLSSDNDRARYFISDDLTLEGDGANVRLKGEYLGFSEGEEETISAPAVTLTRADGTTVTEAAYTYTTKSVRSAIVVNGRNSTLDLTGLSRLSLMGTSYLDGIHRQGSGVSGTANGVEAYSIIGSSLSVKADQLVYLAPAECLGTSDSGVLVGRNPMTQEEFDRWELEWTSINNYQKLDVDKPTAVLGKTLRSYGLTGARSDYVVRVRSVGSQALYYIYLRMGEEQSARYYADYMAKAAERMNLYAEQYKNKISINNTPGTVLSVGALAYTQGSQGEQIQAHGHTAGAQGSLSQQAAMQSLLAEQSAVQGIALHLRAALVPDAGSLTGTQSTAGTPYTNLVKPGLPSPGWVMVDESSGYHAVAVNNPSTPLVYQNDSVSLPGNGTWSKIGLILASGDVHIKSNFQGLIIAGGEIVVDPGVSLIESRKGVLTNLLNAYKYSNRAVTGAYTDPLKTQVDRYDTRYHFCVKYLQNGLDYVQTDIQWDSWNRGAVEIDDVITLKNLRYE